MTLSNFTSGDRWPILLKSSNTIQYYPQLLKFWILYVLKNLNLNVFKFIILKIVQISSVFSRYISYN